ncbi:hypothetical protein [Lacrimispora sp. 38-1]|uniref:TIGR03943 family putative permease subunit n=1 Tax=Lacrimispora sp. 38-1 TaxID=3125778 RepID=UPI003CF67891
MSRCRSKKIVFLVIGLVIVLITGCQSNTNEKMLESSETNSSILTEDGSNSTETEGLEEAKDSGTDSNALTQDSSNTAEMEIWDENENAESAAVEISANQEGVLEIEEDKFVSQVEEVYNYPDKYLGETVKYQGYIFLEEYEGKDYYYVVRNTYACSCGEEESIVGFEIAWEGDIPEEGTWVEVTGVLDSYMEEENQYILVRASDLDIKDEIGKTFVTE